MPVTSIPYQPATGQLIAAYRPIVFKVQATATGGGLTPPFVICDIYLANVYYKSIIRTAPESMESTYSIYQFNISDALQEYLQADLATINNNNLLQASHTSAKVFCRFRSSDVDFNGFTVEEPTAPVQGTKFTDPVAGTGTQSNTFFAINSALQHEDNQNLALHLAAFKQGTWAANAFPLTHRNRYYFCDNDSDHFPLIFTGDCIATKILLHYRLKGQVDFTDDEAQDINVCPSIGFTPSVTGNRVDVHLDTPVTMGTVLVQYKKQADVFWTDVNLFTDQDFFFYVNGDDIAGNYDLRVIHFCTNCLSSDPEIETFTLSGTVINLAWRPINPFCVQQTFVQPIYLALEIRDASSEETDFPDNISPTEKDIVTTGQLYAKFYSDADLLNPLNVVQNGLKIYVMRIDFNNYSNPPYSNSNEVWNVSTYIVDANGTEVLLGSVTTADEHHSYSTYPTETSSSNSTHSYYPYPTKLLVGGNTGDKGWTDLEEYNTDTNVPTGTTKPNDNGDPDYVVPVSDTTTCPNGPDVSTVTYGYGMEVFGVRIYIGATTYISAYVANTQAGGWSYTYPLPKNTNINVSARARTLDTGNTSGHVKIRVSYVDGGGNYQVAEFNLDNNIDTYLPQTFQNVTNINVSNY